MVVLPGVDLFLDNFQDNKQVQPSILALEPKTFIKSFPPRMPQSSGSAVPTPLGHVSKRFEEIGTSGKATSGMLSTLCQ